MRITQEQVRQAEEKAKAAEESRVQAARALEASPYSDLAAAGHAEASQLAAQLGANAREVRQAFEEQVAQERCQVSRQELERAAAAEIDAADEEMVQRQSEVVEALERVQAAVAGLLEVGEAYNAAVRSHTDVLAGAGLDFRGGASGGTRTVLKRCLLQVRGRKYEEVNAAVLAGWAVHRVVVGRLSRFNDVATALQWVARSAETDAPAVVAGVPELGRVEQSRRSSVVDAARALLGSK
ncbi:hypothetical protein [Streptomyces chartreusis]|uniref:hypothetical protein n=1 Tax=Streptomyces chartreusis TaxID=1969 RepID=UPI0036548CD6